MQGLVVLGAGLAGLGCARLHPGCRVFEAAAHAGGHAYSHLQGGVYFDQGAHISHTKDADFSRLIHGCAGDVVPVSPSVVRNVWQGRWISYPVQNHLHDLPLELRGQALTDLIAAHVAGAGGEPENYREWCLRQYGACLTERFYDVFTAKYWRLPAHELATDWLGGRLLPSQLPRIVRGALGLPDEEQAVFARFHYPRRGGFYGFFSPLADGLNLCLNERAAEIDTEQRRIRFHSGRVEFYEHLASSIPLPTLAAITMDLPNDLREAARRLRHTRLLCVNLVVARPWLTDCHWFYCYDAALDAARVSVPSNLAPGSVPADCTALQAEVFRLPDESLVVDEIVERTVAQLGALLQFQPGELRHVGHTLAPFAYVISDHQRAPIVTALRSWYEARGVFTMGLYGRWKYVWSDEAYRQGQETARAILTRTGRSAQAA
jgi:protoporphyrinogen oxidase